jgi:methionyl-tRNA formyltransferase
MNRILVLGRRSNSSKLLCNRLLNAGYDVSFIVERRKDHVTLIYRRVKRFGLAKVILQLVFQVFQRVLQYFSQSRILEILADYNQPLNAIYTCENINAASAIGFIESLDVDLILLSGTRILTSNFLSSVTIPVINIHAGITPKYRGVHGGYWALVNGESNLFGSTIHRVDQGIDTGAVIQYVYTLPTSRDNFSTYPLLQQRVASDAVISLLASGTMLTSAKINARKESKLWSHPTILEYLVFAIKKRIF